MTASFQRSALSLDNWCYGLRFKVYERSVLVYQPDRLPDLLVETDQPPTLDGLALQLSVDTIYGWLQRTG